MAKEEQAAPEAEQAGGSKKKMILIIAIGVVTAIVLGAVAFMVMGKGGKKEGAKTEAAAEGGGGHGAPPPAASGGGHGGGAKGGAPVSNMYSLDPFIVNIYDGQELRYLKMKIELEMAGDFKAEIDSKSPPIRDAILVLLSTKTLQDVHEVQGKNQLREEILGSINKILPPGRVTKVYFTDFVVQ